MTIAPSGRESSHRPAVALAGVSCRFGGRLALDNVSLQVAAGTIVGVLGPNGAGKTTLLSLVTGLRRPAEGEVQVLGGRPHVQGGRLRQRIGVVLQETALYDELTTLENLRFAASLYGVKNQRARLAEVLELLGLRERADEPVRSLSGGLRRRVAIARALIHDPELLVVDEPTLGVDAEARHAIWSHLRLLRTQGRTVLAATNYLDEAEALCDQVAVLRAGRLVAFEAPGILISRAGRVVDIECDANAAAAAKAVLRGQPTILRVEPAAGGLAVFLRGEADSDAVVGAILRVARVSSVRTRAADLAEVFRALDGAA